MLYYLNVNSFAQAENLYNSINPVNEREYGVSRNVRPVGDRSRKHERIVKVSRNCYIMLDGGRGDPLFSWAGARGKLTEREMAMLAPIMWRRDSEGNEFIRIRNETGEGAHISRYSFLERAMPRCMRLGISAGKQYVSVSGRYYYLPKGKTVSRADRAGILESFKKYKNIWTKRWYESTTSRCDNLHLEFKRIDDQNWEAVHAPEMPAPPRTRVNTRAKSQLKPHTDKFWDWLCAVAPLMSDVSWDTRRAYEKQLADYKEEHNIIAYGMTKQLYKEVFRDEQHPLRMYTAYNFVLYSDMYDQYYPCTDEKKLRAKFNRWVNKVCGLTTTVKE